MTRLTDRELAALESAKGSIHPFEAQALITEARRLQNEKIAELLAHFGRTFAAVSGLTALTRRLRRQALYRRTVRELVRLDAAQLRDIGLLRAEIAAKALTSSRAAVPAVPGWWTAVAQTVRRFRMERQTASQLRRLDDRMLRDIGLERSEIDRVAAAIAEGRGAFERPRTNTAVFGLKRPAVSDGMTAGEPANSEQAAAA